MATHATKSQEEEGSSLAFESEFFDGVFLFDDGDRDRALRDITLLLNDEKTVLRNGRHPKILKRYDPIGECCETNCDFIVWLEKALSCSTFVLVYTSKHFFSSVFKTQIQSHIMHHSFEVDGAVYDKIGNQQNLIPVRPNEKGNIIMKMPFTQLGFQLSDYENEEYRDDFCTRFVATFNARLYVREEREQRALEKERIAQITSTDAIGQLNDCIDKPEIAKEECFVEECKAAPVYGAKPDLIMPYSVPRIPKKKRLPFVHDPSLVHLP